jgi:thymidine kinase
MGTLELIIGPMFSGKTSLLIDSYNDLYDFNNKNKVIAINYDKDNRYGDNKIASHNGKEIQCVSVNTLYELDSYNTEFTNQKLHSVEYIFINEAQFFKDLKLWVINQVETKNKNVILCGLDSDFKREKFGDIWDLIPHANKITKLHGTCQKCSNPSIYTYRLSDEVNQEVIGTNNYIPVCRSCYNSLTYMSTTNHTNNYGLVYNMQQ